jgi:thymidylate kinase
MIIVEGCDATGKSTLIAALQEHFRIPAIRSGMRSPSLEDMERYHTSLQNFPLPVILDRHPAISDYVYAHCLRGGQTESTIEFAQRCREHTFLIYAIPPFEVVEQNILNNPQMEGVEDSLLHIYEAYKRMAQKTGYDMLYDYTQPNEKIRIINGINSRLRSRN